jgi:tetratricopeptide (TPR) repeat protein
VRKRMMLLVGGASAVALALGSLVGGVLAEPSSPSEPTAAPRALVDPALAAAGGGVAVGAGPSAVARLESEVRSRPRDASILTQLGFAYQLRWRETSEPSFLPRSEAALRRALEAEPAEPNAILGLGSLALIKHEFRAALRYGRRARTLLPGSGRPYGVIGDALVELGRYDAAFAAFERMVTLRPNLASYARIAYARELSGDLGGALGAMRLALGAAAGQPEPTAFTLVEVAKLESLLGRSRASERHARAALLAVPGYPAARLVLARLDARAGRLGRAVAGARRAANVVPASESFALLADLLDRTGRKVEARTARRTVAAMDRLLEASGIEVDLESAVHRADLGIRPQETVELARRARANRPSIFGDDALGWALARAGRCREALPLLGRSLRLGTKDPLLYFHRGYAEGCVGSRGEMRAWYERALALDPEFSLRWAQVARATLVC